MLRFVLARLSGLVIVMFLVATIVFVISRVIPGDPAAVMLGAAATAEDAARLKAQLGLDAPLLQQYIRWIAQLLQFDLGQSIFLGQSVNAALSERAELTVALASLGLAMALATGIPVGIAVAVWRGRSSIVC